MLPGCVSRVLVVGAMQGLLLALHRNCAFALMCQLGFDMDEQTFEDLFQEVDSRGDGTVTRNELITALGMVSLSPLTPLTYQLLTSFLSPYSQLKQDILEVNELQKAFTRLREGRNKVISSPHPATAKSWPLGDKLRPSQWQSKAVQAPKPAEGPKLEDHLVYASDLVGTLGVTEAQAEEMIFIADLVNNQAIDFTEFKQVVVNWS